MEFKHGINRRIFLAKMAATAAVQLSGRRATPESSQQPITGINSFGNVQPVSADSIAAGVLPPSAWLPNGAPPAAPADAITGQPNFLIVMVDQMRVPRWLPTAGQAGINALDAICPNITWLRKRSYSFGNYFTAATECMPARATLLTGLYSQQQCMFLGQSSSNSPSLQTGFPTFATALADTLGTGWLTKLGLQTYDAAWIGKWHLSQGSVADYGFENPDSLPNGSNYPSPNGWANEGTLGGKPGSPYASNIDDNQILKQYDTWVTDKTSVQANATKPWLCVVSFLNPHDITWAPAAFGLTPGTDFISPTQWPPPSQPYFPAPHTSGGADEDGSYPGLPTPPAFTSLPVDSAGNPWNGIDPAVQVPYSQGSVSTGTLAKPDLQRVFLQYLTDLLGTVTPYSPDNQQNWQAGWLTFLNYYYWMQACADKMVGRVITSLASLYPDGTSTLGNNTIVIFLSDHGEYAGSHSLHNKGGAAYDEAINVPLYISYPTQRSGTPNEIHRNQMVSSVDLIAFLLTSASQYQTTNSWRNSGPWTYLAGREEITDFILYNIVPQHQRRKVTVNGVILPYILHTYDQNQPGSYDDSSIITYDSVSPPLPYHVIALRTAIVKSETASYGAKIASYSTWPACPLTYPTQDSVVQWEFYDYGTGNVYEIGNDAFNADTQQAMAQYQQLLLLRGPNSVLPTELYYIPTRLSSAHNSALVAYFAALTPPQSCSS